MDAFMWLFVTAVVLVVALIRSRRSMPEVHEGRLPPGDMGLPFIGKTIDFARKKVALFKEGHDRYGRVFKTRLFGISIARVYGAENIRTIIQGENKIVQSSYPTSVRKLLGNQSISMSHGETHKKNKGHLMKFLCPEFFANHVPVMSQIIADRVDSWTQQPVIDLYEETKKLFVELSARFLINIEIKDENLTKLIEQLDIFTKNIFCLPVNLPGFGFHKALKAKYALRKIIAESLHQAESNNNETDELSSVLQRLVEDPETSNVKAEDNIVLIDTIIDLLFSGAQTVTSAGCTIAHKLCTRTDVREKVQEDINAQSLEDAQETVCYNDVTNMTYVNAVVKETLRLRPPVGGAYRTVLEPFELDGYTIPKGWSVVFSIRETQMEEKTFGDADSFVPDRWLNTKEGVKDRYSYLPFGAGGRICPGQAYAKMILKLFTMELTRSCNPVLVKDSEFVLFPSPKPKDQILIRLERKNTEPSICSYH